MPEFVLNVQEIDETGKSCAFSISTTWLASVLVGTDVRADQSGPEGRFELQVHKQGADIVLRGELTGGLVTDCSRCLEDARIAVRTEVVSLLTRSGGDAHTVPEELELTPEDLDREFFTGDQIVLDDIVREHLLLEVPIQPLCTVECPGIPIPASVAGPPDLWDVGRSGGIDPRLAPLLKLVGKKPTEE